MLRLIALLFLAAAAPIGPAIDRHDWAAAGQAAAQLPDPVAARLVTWLRLRTPGGGSAAEIAGFLAQNPDWPEQGRLTQLLAAALAREPDDAAVRSICRERPPAGAAALLRCAEAAPGTEEAQDEARRAWVAGLADPGQEAGFLGRWSGRLTEEDQWRRFDRLAWAGDAAAARQARRLDAAHARLAAARLAFRRQDANALAVLASVPAALRTDPTLMLEQARYLRRSGAEAAAAALWGAAGAAAEAAAPAERRPAFWAEREILARHRLLAGDDASALALAEDAAASGTQRLESLALHGWIALERRHDPARAETDFAALAKASPAAITQARAGYWRGRAAAAAGDAAGAARFYRAAAAWPVTYYGQLAARALGEDDAALAARLRAADDTRWSDARGLAFAQAPLARAALLLAAWGHAGEARPFLLALDERAGDATGRALAAQMAASLGLPDVAVRIARRAGRDGLMLPRTGWPEVASPPPGLLPAALALAVMRQESGFDADAVSPAGAVGLMQLMPRTAEEVAVGAGDAPGVPALHDPGTNMRLGAMYLHRLLDRFDGVLPYAVAAYNAGPTRVRGWLEAMGDPAAAGGAASRSGDMIDWIEAIPVAETRDYVQRVIENLVVYRLKGVAGPGLDATAGWIGFRAAAPAASHS